MVKIACIIMEFLWYMRIRIPGKVLPGGGRLGLKYGSSHKIWEVWKS